MTVIVNMLPYLHRAGHETAVLFQPEQPTSTPVLELQADRIVRDGYDVVCFQKVEGPTALALATALKSRGIRTLSVVCDWVYADMARVVDATLVVTDYLKSLYPADLHPKIHVVHDGIENPDAYKTTWRSDAGSRRNPLHAVLVTSSRLDHLPVFRAPPPWLRVTVVGLYPDRIGVVSHMHDLQGRFRLKRGWRVFADYARFVASPRIACVPWHPVDVYRRMVEADIGILAFDTPVVDAPEIGAPRWKVKSENRLTMKMSIGLPVIATPIPAYEPIIRQGVNGHLARSAPDWLEAFEVLRDPTSRRRIGDDARGSVLERYSKEAQAARWLRILDQFASRDAPHEDALRVAGR